jgi:thiopurine S-methyltransferase
VRFIDQLGPAQTVLVPLCGKAADLAFLADHGHTVVGIELVETAAVAFFSERDLTPTITDDGSLRRYHHDAITIIVGDFFACTRDHVGPVTALYDRAAVIALPEPMRRAYVAHVRRLLPLGAAGLIVTVEYPQAVMDGPPFSVSEAELRSLYSGSTIELLADGPVVSPRLTAAGATGKERCFALSAG